MNILSEKSNNNSVNVTESEKNTNVSPDSSTENTAQTEVIPEVKPVPEISKEKIFSAITDFIKQLVSVFEDETKKTATPLKLFNRVIEKPDNEKVDTVIMSFKSFFQAHNTHITGRSIPEKANETVREMFKIRYNKSQRIYLDIQNFIYKSDEQTREAIYNHLNCIMWLLNPTGENPMNVGGFNMEGLFDAGSPEEQVLEDIITKIQDGLQDSNVSSPQEAFMKLISNGTLTNLFGETTNLVQNFGKLNKKKLIGTLKKNLEKIEKSLPEEN